MVGADLPSDGPIVVLGAGYAGLRIVHDFGRAAKGRFPVVLVNRLPQHVLRTELYEVDRLAAAGPSARRWAVPMAKALGSSGATYREGEVAAIDLVRRTVSVAGSEVAYRALAICLGSVPAYYGVAGADVHAHSVYRLSGAQRLASALREAEAAGAAPGGRPPRVVVVGGGATGTELAAEIATARWDRVVGAKAPTPEVTLVTGSVPFLEGLPSGLVAHARALLARAHVRMIEAKNAKTVRPDAVVLADGTEVPFDVAAWCAGVQAPPLLRSLPVPHGHGGRLAVDPHLELPGFPGVFAVGDVAEFVDPRTRMVVPATAQAALAEAPVAATNLLARLTGRPLRSFVYREHGVIVSLGLRQAAAAAGRLTIWGSPAALFKRVVEKEYAVATGHGAAPPGL